jgi:hypothetical protein
MVKQESPVQLSPKEYRILKAQLTAYGKIRCSDSDELLKNCGIEEALIVDPEEGKCQVHGSQATSTTTT